MKLLTDKELSYIAKLDLEQELAKAKLALCLLKINNLELKQKILFHELTNEKNNLENLRSLEASSKINRQEALKTMQKKHKLKDGWGFNPDSGEIVDGGQQ